jgi:hypothetical protein
MAKSAKKHYCFGKKIEKKVSNSYQGAVNSYQLAVLLFAIYA